MPTKSLASTRRSHQRRRQARSIPPQQSDKKARSRRGLRVSSSDNVETCFDMCRDLGYHRDPDIEVGWKARGKESNQYSILDQDLPFGSVPGAFDNFEFTFSGDPRHDVAIGEANVEHWDQPEPSTGLIAVDTTKTSIQADVSDNRLQPSVLDISTSVPHVSLPPSTTERKWSIPSPLLYHRKSESRPNSVRDLSLQQGQEPPNPDFETYKMQNASQVPSAGHINGFSQATTPPAASSGYRPEIHGTLVKRTPQPSISHHSLTTPSTSKKPFQASSHPILFNDASTLPWPLVNLSVCPSPQCIALVPMEHYPYTQTVFDWLRDAHPDCGAEQIANAIEWAAKDLGMDMNHSRECCIGETSPEDDLEVCFLSSEDEGDEQNDKEKAEEEEWEWISSEEG